MLRFYDFTAPTDGFTGIVLEDGRTVGTYGEPRLRIDPLLAEV